MKTIFKKSLLLGLSLMSFQGISQETTLEDFKMFWQFTDANGHNEVYYEDICPCGTVYLKNTSLYDIFNPTPGNPSTNGTPISNYLEDVAGGYYKFTHIPSNTQIRPNLDDDNWDYDQVLAINIPCNMTSMFNFSADNFQVQHYGPGVSPPANNSTARKHSKNLNVNPNPTVDAGTDQTVCQMQAVSLSANGSGNDFLWSTGHNGSGASGANHPTMWLNNTTLFSVTNSTTYNNHSGSGTITCSASDDVLITVDHGPSIQGQSFLLCDGDDMPVIYTDLGQVSTDWNYTASGSNTSTNIGTYPHVYTEYYGYGEYELTATNGNGCSSTGTYYVELSQSAGSNIDPDFNMTATLSGANVSINVNAYQGAGNHNWILYQCPDGTGSGCSYVNSSTGNESGYTFYNLSAGVDYKVVHNLSMSPCNELTSHSHMGKLSMVEPPIVRRRGHESGSGMPVLFSVFPNPSNGTTNIVIEEFEAEANYLFEVYNMVGQKVHTTTINNSNQNVDLSEFENGHYLFTLTSGSEVSQIKFIKQ